MSERRQAWRWYADSATASARDPHRPVGEGSSGPAPAHALAGRGLIAVRRRLDRLLDRRAQRRSNKAAEARPAPRPWRDLRLAPLAAALWAGAAWAESGPSMGLSAGATALVAAAVGLGGLGGATGWWVFARTTRRHPRPRLDRGGSRGGRARAGKRAINGTLGALLLSGALSLAWGSGFSASSARLAHDAAGPVAELIDEGGATVAVVEVLAEPHRLRPSGRDSQEARFAANARLLEGTRAGLRFSASVRIIVTGGEALSRLGVGEIVRAPVRVRAAAPGEAPFVTLAGPPRPVGVSGSASGAARARDALRQLAGRLPADAAGLVPALATGDRSRLDPQLEEDMRTAGLGHLTAVSGANFAIVLGCATLGLRLARCPRWAVVAGCAVTLVAFVAVVGPEPSVLRAAAMGSVGLLALAMGRPGPGCSALSLAVVVILLADPALSLSLGFLLSVLATLGIILIAPRLAAALCAHLPDWLSLAVAVPLSAQLLCGPVLVLVQPQFQTWSLAANIVTAPLVPLITIASTLALAAACLAPPVASLAIAVAGPPAELLALVAHMAAALPSARLEWPEGPLGVVAMGFVSALNGAAVLATGDPRVRRGATALADRALRLAAGRPREKVDG